MISPLLFALACTAAAVLLSSVAAAVVGAVQRALAERQRRIARDDETALLAGAVRRWRTTPHAWGGAADGFRGVSFDAVGVATCPARGGRHTPHGTYRLVHVPPCPALDRALVRTGHDRGGDAVLVVGWDPVTAEDTSVLVLGPLVQVPLARVPWAWIAELTQTAADAEIVEARAEAAPLPLPVDETADDVATHVARRPRLRLVAPDRPAVPTLRLVAWPARPPALQRWPDRTPDRGPPRVHQRQAA